MRVQIRLFANLRQYAPGGEHVFELELSPGATAGQLLKSLHIPSTEEKVILVNWSGHGLIDLGAYERYLSKQLEDYELPDEMLEKAEEVFKGFPKPALVKSR